MKKAFITLSLIPVFFLSFAPLAFAQGGTGSTDVSIDFKIENPFKGDNNDLVSLMKSILDNIIMPIGGVLCVLAFIWAGFKYVMAQGNSTKIAEANKTLLYAAIGTAILLGAVLIQELLQNTFNQVLK